MPQNDPPTIVEQDRLRLLFRQARSASLLAIVAASACTAILFHARPTVWPLLWFAGVLAATLLRFWLYQRFFTTDPNRHPRSYWLSRHRWSGALVGVAWGSLPLVPLEGTSPFIQELQILVPAFMVMAAITSYGIYFSHYLVLLGSTIGTAVALLIVQRGAEALPTATLFLLFAPVLALTARRFAESLRSSLAAERRAERLVGELSSANADLLHRNARLGEQQSILEQEEALARHVFHQLTAGGDHSDRGVRVWNQSMGNLSGDLTQTAKGPDGQVYIFLGDFTGHGLPAALGALPTSSVFLAMANKGLPVGEIAAELNRKLHQLLPVGYFCCAVLIELAPNRRSVEIFNGGLPPVLIRRRGAEDYERVTSLNVPLGVLESEYFQPETEVCALGHGDLLYAYTDGLTEAVNVEGEMWGAARLEAFLLRRDIKPSKLPALIDAVLEHVNLAPPSDDISIVEIESLPTRKAAAA